jgi:hypothetical protein
LLEKHHLQPHGTGGAFGDLGTMLPIVIGMILINKLSPTVVFLSFGVFYIITGCYYKLPAPMLLKINPTAMTIDPASPRMMITEMLMAIRIPELFFLFNFEVFC